MKLTHAQTNYRARKEIVKRLQAVEVWIGFGRGSDHGATQKVGYLLETEPSNGGWTEEEVANVLGKSFVDAYMLAERDLAEATRIVEEEAAYSYLVPRRFTQYPSVPKREIQQEVRRVLAVPDIRHKYARESGLYELLEGATA